MGRRFLFAFMMIATAASLVMAWTALPVKDDPNLFMPGSQPGTVGTFEAVGRCENCHAGYDSAVEPGHNWRGSMMAQAARDPMWLACMSTALQDSIWAVGNPNAGDLCIRCHTPVGWLEGRSDPTNLTALVTSDFDGLQCDFCHKRVDPFAELKQPDVPAETNPTAITMANETYLVDIQSLLNVKLFDNSNFLNATTKLPTHYGNGALPNYIEATSGQFFTDSSNVKRGPFFDADARHQFYYSRYHKSKEFCNACHDVSNPVLASLVLGQTVPETQAACTYFHVERTTSEFNLSIYGQGGSATNLPNVPFANKCQDCHMRDVTGAGCNKAGVPIRTDLPLHDLTGGNQWISRILASVDSAGPVYDAYNFNILSGAKYAGAQIQVAGLAGQGQRLVDGSNRAVQMLQNAANLSPVSENASQLTLRILNNGAHKLISGFPEGRRMFLSINFLNSTGQTIGQVNPYQPLVISTDGNGNAVYVSGGDLTETHEDLVWEAKMSSTLTGEEKTFHFVLGTDRYKDNRIPPKGFNASAMTQRLAQPKWHGADAPSYFTASEYAGGYDDVTVDKPAGTASWTATLNYQTTSKGYITFLRDEIKGTGTLTLPPTAYVCQTDPFFSTLKGWGDAIWDLWLHNNGCAPVIMETLSGTSPATPTGTPPTATPTRTSTSVPTNTATPTRTSTSVPPNTATPTRTPTRTPTPTSASTIAPTNTMTSTRTNTATSTSTNTRTPTRTATMVPTATPTVPSVPPVITDVTRDKHVLLGPPHISDWVDITFESVNGVAYDIYTSPSMTTPVWIVAASVTATGISTTWRDTGPVNVERYYRIGIQGAVPVVYSTNEGGVLPSTVLDRDGTEQSQAAMMGVSLNSTEAATTIQEVIGWQMVGADIPDTSTEIWAWAALSNAYALSWLIEGMGPTYDGTWWDNNLGGPATIDMSLGAGFWVFNKQASVQNVTMDGIVQQTPYPMSVYVDATALRSHQQGQPLAADVSIQEAEFFVDGAYGSDIPDLADEVWQFDQTSNGYTLCWLINGMGPTYDGKWWDNNLGDFSTIVLTRGTCWWYFSKANAARTPSWVWTEPVPY